MNGSNTFQIQGVKKWEKSVLNNLSIIRQALILHVLPTIERLMIFLTDLSGFAKWRVSIRKHLHEIKFDLNSFMYVGIRMYILSHWMNLSFLTCF